LLDERVDFVDKDLARYAATALELFEAPGSVERLTKEHPHPPFAPYVVESNYRELTET
jgi:hypothetical protein